MGVGNPILYWSVAHLSLIKKTQLYLFVFYVTIKLDATDE